MRIKTCSMCGAVGPLWKAKPYECCKSCWLKIKAQESLSPFDSTKLPQKPKSRSYRIKSVSDKKLTQLKEYRKKRDAFMKANPICQFPDCKEKATDTHHSRGRTGSLLTDERYFKALCRAHHQFVEVNVVEAKKLGLSASRLDREEER